MQEFEAERATSAKVCRRKTPGVLGHGEYRSV